MLLRGSSSSYVLLDGDDTHPLGDDRVVRYTWGQSEWYSEGGGYGWRMGAEWTLPDSIKQIVREAMAEWESVCGIRFVETEGPYDYTADLRITHYDALEDPAAGRGGTTLEWRDGQWVMVGNVYINEFYMAGHDDDYWLYVVLHEIGHAIGISHSDVDGQIMSGNGVVGNTEYWRGTELQPDDIAAAQHLYGPPEPVRLLGSNRDDVLTGQNPITTIWGNGGADTFVIQSGTTWIMDYDPTEGDRIVGLTDDHTWSDGHNTAIYDGGVNPWTADVVVWLADTTLDDLFGAA